MEHFIYHFILYIGVRDGLKRQSHTLIKHFCLFPPKIGRPIWARITPILFPCQYLCGFRGVQRPRILLWGEELSYKMQILYPRATERFYSLSLDFSRAVSKSCSHPRYSQIDIFPSAFLLSAGAYSHVSVHLTCVYFELMIYTSCVFMLLSPIKSSLKFPQKGFLLFHVSYLLRRRDMFIILL